MVSQNQANPQRLAVRVTPVAERAIKSGHPWLFESGIQSVSDGGRSGDLAIIFDRKNRFLAVGLYDPTSMIRVRILQHSQPAAINREWFQAKIEAAAQIRAALPGTQTTGYRLVHGENDGLPGLVIDRYDRTFVMKLYTPAWLAHLPDVVKALVDAVGPQRIVLRLNRDVVGQKELLDGWLDGSTILGSPPDGPVRFTENGLRFEADVIAGQKTGFFLDQRENRARVERLARGKSVLNVFAYTGGFSLYAARGGATAVTSIDISQPALEAAAGNFALNPALERVPHTLIEGDAFQKLTRFGKDRRRFDLVIIDPPSFAKSQAEVDGAKAAYSRLVRLGLDVLNRNGTLVMASCSSRVAADEFFELVSETAKKVGRPLHELERTTHALDHPIGFPEGAYLKCLFTRVS
ncbi:MAG: class I SAM-dependent methyltransferase [Ardenticatenaceae bacterium]|nr:class I SAM-dependent methyltransferase [Ardenticatenaceae bacterium]